VKYLYFSIAFFLFATHVAFAQNKVCPNGKFTFNSTTTGTSYQWKLEVDTGFLSLTDNSTYSGTQSAQLQINNAPATWAGYSYRCFVNGKPGKSFEIRFTNEWKGTVGINWENAGNWSCGTVPDEFTDVIVNNSAANPLEINNTVFCRTFTASPNAAIKINAGGHLSITQPGQPVELLGEDDASILDKLPNLIVPLDSIIMEDGQSVQQFLNRYGLARQRQNRPSQVTETLINTKENQKKLYQANITKWGDYLVTDSNFVHSADDITPPLVGLNYMPGGKQYQLPQNPTVGGCMDSLYYGLDCSGMVYIITTKAGLPAVVPKAMFSVANISDTAKWNRAFRSTKDMDIKYDSLVMDQLTKEQCPKDSFKLGDVIIWPQGPHVGIVLNTAIYQSNGSFDAPGCKSNRSDSRGPTIKPLTQAWLDAFGGGNYMVFRVGFKKFTVFNNTNTPVFGANNSFKAVGIGKGKNVYAGTANNGLYRYNGKVWEKMAILTDNFIQDIQTDKDNGVWIAQSGRTGAQALTGGVNWLPDSTLDGNEYISATRGLPTRYCRGIFIDTSRTNSNAGGPTPRVWTANMPDITAGVSKTGAVGLGYFTDDFSKGFQIIKEGIDVANIASIQLIGGNSNEVWVYANANFGKNQILKYDAATTNLIGSYDLDGTIGTPRAIYFDSAGRKWVAGTSGSALVFTTGNNNTVVNFNQLTGVSLSVNINAISGGRGGKVYIGTTQGLLIYDGKGAVTNAASYKRITTTDGLPVNNVLDVVEMKDGTVVMGTDAGIVFMN
jgi:hypothetical protein